MSDFELRLPNKIYLMDMGDGIVWCEDPAPGIGMEEFDSVEYVRTDREKTEPFADREYKIFYIGPEGKKHLCGEATTMEKALHVRNLRREEFEGYEIGILEKETVCREYRYK